MTLLLVQKMSAGCQNVCLGQENPDPGPDLQGPASDKLQWATFFATGNHYIEVSSLYCCFSLVLANLSQGPCTPGQDKHFDTLQAFFDQKLRPQCLSKVTVLATSMETSFGSNRQRAKKAGYHAELFWSAPSP